MTVQTILLYGHKQSGHRWLTGQLHKEDGVMKVYLPSIDDMGEIELPGDMYCLEAEIEGVCWDDVSHVTIRGCAGDNLIRSGRHNVLATSMNGKPRYHMLQLQDLHSISDLSVSVKYKDAREDINPSYLICMIVLRRIYF